nr:MAG TPA: hypothetical protein [Caudoviricetes sp.]
MQYKKIYNMSTKEKKDQNLGEFWAAVAGLLAIIKTLF